MAMKSGLLRFALVFGAGMGLVWVFAVGPEGSVFGRKTPQQTTPALASDTPPGRRPPPTAGSVPTGPDAGIEVRALAIPVREELEDDPAVMVVKYWIHIGESVGAIEKRMRARDVRVDIHNKELPPDERVIARVHGNSALIWFTTAPDPRIGFRDTGIDAMTLSDGVLVEYLDDAGAVATTLRSEQLELSDVRFHAPGRATIEQPGLVFSGEDLTYDKATGVFRFEREVEARITNFSLPGRGAPRTADDAADDAAEDAAPTAAAAEKVIRCKGAFSFVPAEEPDDAGSDRPGADLAQAVGGGVLTFEDDVHASQGETLLRECARLILHVDKAVDPTAPAPEPSQEEAAGELEVTRVEAYGPAGKRAVLFDPRAELFGDVMLMEPTPAGHALELLGSPEIRNVAMGGPSEEGAAPAALSAGAQQAIRIRPLVQEEAAHVVAPAAADRPDPAEPVPATRMVLELHQAGWLRSDDPDPTRAFRVDGDRVDVFFRRTTPVRDPVDAVPAEADGAGAADPTESFELESLLAEGRARGTFALGSIEGDRIVGVPQGSGDHASFSLTVTPNPVVDLLLSAAKPEADAETDAAPPEQRIRIESAAGELTYTPPAMPGDATAAIVRGPTSVVVREADAIVTTLDATRFVSFDFSDTGEDSGLRALEAEGDVVFDSPRDGVNGTGDRLRLQPRAQGSYKIVLTGTPAMVSREMPDQEPQVIHARFIEFDPETNTLHAVDRVDLVRASVAAIAGQEGAEGQKGAKPGELRCEELDLLPVSTDDGAEDMLLHARGRVTFEDATLGISARGDQLLFRRSEGVAELLGADGERASMTRLAAEEVAGSKASDADPAPEVSIEGPRLIIDQATSRVSAPLDGEVILLSSDAKTGRRTRVFARCAGPLDYRDDQLLLRDDVLVRFEEHQPEHDVWDEVRALWCDATTVFFTPADAADATPAGAAANELAFDRLLAEGRVHLEQTAPRPLIGAGDSLEWRMNAGRREMVLRGVHPRAWVDGLLTNKHLRYVADTFWFYEDSDEFAVENGEFVFVEGER